ncbi:WAT1-related protein At5g40210-like isoform X1 [Neltuma alba]|uniref:WAT1-related protein At5g40210-like isoform X1 n=1 Tax=Neltuma alba TaxID=207710 RepID=UPI0010A4822F|nr:WAT1-related protein At5g40210-like isoform X1 [Prosopis alba]
MEDLKVTILMVAVQVNEVVLNTLIKAATDEGMSDYVFVVYSNAVAFSLLLPSSFFYYRNRPSPPITFSIICRIFLLSLLICAAQTMVYVGIGYSSPVLSSVMGDLSPAFTFLLAIIFRYEKVEMRQVSSHAKCIGTVLSTTGALMVTLYRGEANSGDSNLEDDKAIVLPQDEWLLGGVLLALGSFCLSVVFNVKTWIMKEYPEVMMIATISCGFVAMLSAMVSLIAEGDNAQAWTLRADMELAAILYSGIIVVSMRSLTNIWACGRKGPVYVAMFTPLGMVIALAMGLVFLGESLSLGSVIGGGVITIGFYGVLWGQAQQEKMAFQTTVICSSVSSSSNAVPLLQNQCV